jgi:hypothetical protein
MNSCVHGTLRCKLVNTMTVEYACMSIIGPANARATPMATHTLGRAFQPVCSMRVVTAKGARVQHRDKQQMEVTILGTTCTGGLIRHVVTGLLMSCM